LHHKIINRADLYLHIPLLTVGFLHCKNVNRIDVTDEQGPTRKWCRRQRVPELKYHTVQIDPNLSIKRCADGRTAEGDRSGKALHICRGISPTSETMA